MTLKSLRVAFVLLFSAVVCHAETVSAPDGAIIYYETKGQGKPILFVHGWTGTGKFWQKQVEGLSKDFQVIVVDLRAHGNSSKALQGHSIPQYARDVRLVMDTLKLSGVTLVGWSLAGPVVLEYWKQYGADKVRALGLVDMTPFPFSPSGWNAHGMKNYNYDRMHAFFTALQDSRDDTAEKFINNMFKTGVASKEDMDWIMTETLKTPTPVAVAIYSDYLMRDYTDVLKTISVPTLVCAGDSNIFKKGIEMGRYVGSQIPGSTFVPFENGGHMPFYENAEKFNRDLSAFVKAIK